MRLFGWMQNKLGGKQDKKISETLPSTSHAKQVAREEFSDWQQGLFSVGTFGNDDIKVITESQTSINLENPSSSTEESDEILDIITPEEVGKLQKALTKLLSKKPNKPENTGDLPLDRFLNCPSSLEVDRRISNALMRSDSEDYRDEEIDKTISVIIGRCKEVMSESEKKKRVGIGKKSISILLKKMFVCRSGFAPVPSLRDTLQESRMEKILRTMLHKTISPQHSHRASSMKKYIEEKATPSKKDDDQKSQHQDRDRITPQDGSKWVKTDSEFIVLEI